VFDEEPDRLRLIYDNLPTSAPVSVAELAVVSSLQPEEVPPAIDALRAKGAWVVGDPSDGYRRQLPPPLDPGAISALVEGRVGAALFLHDAIVSTMVKARELAAEDGCHGAAVLAEEQVAGRGRYGRGWSSPRRLGLYISVILEKRYLTPRFSLLPLMAGVAVADAIATEAGVAAEMKWPNDLLWKGAKLGGILGETFDEPAAVVLGVGVNVFQCPFDFPNRVLYPATSLAQAGAEHVDRNALAAEMLNSLDRWLVRWLEHGAEPVVAAWRERNVTLGRRVRIAGTGVAGVAVDLTEDGALVVEDNTGQRRVFYSADA
jgi:BirA family biotin operon repressor/biotin-[acetyl-CoA-carboxylase] ligase